MKTQRILLLLFLCWGCCLTSVFAQYSDVFVGKKGSEYTFVNIQLPVSSTIPPRFDRWLANRFFAVKDSSLYLAHRAYVDQYDRMMKPSPSTLQKADKRKHEFALKWNSYVEGRYASFYVSIHKTTGKGKSEKFVKRNFLYDLQKMRNVKLEDIFQMTALSTIYDSFKGRHYDPVIKDNGTFVLKFEDEKGVAKEATFDFSNPQTAQYFKPDFLNLIGIAAPETPSTVVSNNIAKGNGNNKKQVNDASNDKKPYSGTNRKTFVLIFANEHYQEEVPVEFAVNDGKAFHQCCLQELGIPKENIHFRSDATLNHMHRELQWLKDVAHAYQGDIRIIIYYAGHGIPDEATGQSYLLPVDGTGASLITGYKLDTFYQFLSQIPSKEILVFLDACFSGSNRGKGMLTSARGVAIKAKSDIPKGNMIVFSASQGNETAYPFREKEHGLFTYYLLEKLQESKGAVSLGELKDYVSTEVLRKSVVINGKKQTPALTTSPGIGATWKNLKIK